MDGSLEGAAVRLPVVEIFETVEGEGTTAGYPTVFIRIHGCPLRCAWCDTPYSYAPAKPEMTLSIADICARAESFGAARACVTGGEPLMYGARSAALLNALAAAEQFVDIHVETSGAVPLAGFLASVPSPKVRYIVDCKLPASGEAARMHMPNLDCLRPQDELKFVIADDADFAAACRIVEERKPRGTLLFSPVFGRMEPAALVEKMLARRLANVKLSLQMHKMIWDPLRRGV